jgi:hypothetical protein
MRFRAKLNQHARADVAGAHLLVCMMVWLWSRGPHCGGSRSGAAPGALSGCRRRSAGSYGTPRPPHATHSLFRLSRRTGLCPRAWAAAAVAAVRSCACAPFLVWNRRASATCACRHRCVLRRCYGAALVESIEKISVTMRMVLTDKRLRWFAVTEDDNLVVYAGLEAVWTQARRVRTHDVM